MKQQELLDKLNDAWERCEVGEDFSGSRTEAASRDGQADAFSKAYGWVEAYFKQVSQ
jgi:hypothetical protein